jgi:predicted HicB family RNase H-like nuclease
MKTISLRLPDDVHAEAVLAAQEDERSLNTEIVRLLRNALQMRRGAMDRAASYKEEG